MINKRLNIKPKPQGRPNLQGGSGESERVTIRLVPSMRKFVKRSAKLEGVTDSDWIRALIEKKMSEKK